MTERKSFDPATTEMLEVAQARGVSTPFDRAETTKPCPIGHDGSCCKHCFMGPCRLVGKTTMGVCGATAETVVARNLGRAVAAGSAAHGDHGRNMALTLLAVAHGEAKDYQIKDERKLYRVAGFLGVDTAGRSIQEIGADVAQVALDEFGRQEGELIYLKRAPQKRQELWRRTNLAPRGIDREVVEMMHRTNMGTDQDAEHILHHALRCALADGWGGSMLATDLSDILFGTPGPLAAPGNYGVLKEDEVNIVIHGHEPTVPEAMVVMVNDPELIEYARSKGAKGINLVGMCCSGNEILMRHGIPVAGNFLQQELAIATGAVEAMVVDYQCIMQGVVQAARQFHTQVITTSPKVKIEGAMHIEFDERRANELAKLIIRTAIDAFPNRKEVQIPDVRDQVVVGFSHEYLAYMQGGFYRESFRPLNDNIRNGRIRGAAGVVGCNNAHTTHDLSHISIVKELIKNDVVVVTTGCDAVACAKYGLLTPEVMEYAGPGLREVCETIGVPPVLHMGSCVDNTRILTVLTQMATEGGLGEDISDLPAVGIAPEWMSEKALGIGCYFVASGCYVLFGVGSPVAGSPEVQRLISQGWEELCGGKLEFEPDWRKIVEKALAHIDAKRAALKLDAYDPRRYARSQTYLPGDYASWEDFRAGKYSLKG
ncbi:MAG TPA: anaerobic carbon-monoxide dehydrogenase catalytic subunit [Dehalococcoidia bacterium]|nr:anaerobic carbon-monoxide dehydrogenase catalytic subunit [Dehalococcoidia bacterium]